MPRYYELLESSTITGAVLVAVPACAWLYLGSLSWMDVVVGLIGISSFAVAVLDLLRSRTRSLQAPRSGERHTACPRSGEPLMESA